MSEVLFVGGIADGELRQYDVARQGPVIRVAPIERLPLPAVISKNPRATTAIRSQDYKVHQFRGEHTERWIAAPSDWDADHILTALVRGYKARA